MPQAPTQPKLESLAAFLSGDAALGLEIDVFDVPAAPGPRVITVAPGATPLLLRSGVAYRVCVRRTGGALSYVEASPK